MIPTTTGAAGAVGKVIPELEGKLSGIAVRVPTANGSLTDFVAVLEESTTAEAVNAAFEKAAKDRLKGILEFSREPLVSTDIIGNPHSCIFDSQMTTVTDGHLVKVLGWYDNEWGYANRCVDLIQKLFNMPS
jgi:glyceraldehyde 3-phosphate dehydrogenase